MNNQREAEKDRITRQSKDILNKNGYSFQYSVIHELAKVCQNWRFYGAEIPVSTRGKNTHIDLVFQDPTSFFYLIGECKRVQPQFADWFFVKIPFNSRKADKYPPLILDQLQETRVNADQEIKKNITHYSRVLTSDIYGLGFRVKKHLNDGEVECQSSIDVIYESLEQVLLSTSGFINLVSHIVRPSNFTKYTYSHHFLPVIFTTANLWVSDDSIATADLTNGNLASLDTVKNVPYLWFNYNRPRGFSPEFQEFTFFYNQPFATHTQAPQDNVFKESSDYGNYGFEHEDFTRSVLIINSSRLAEMNTFNGSYFELRQ